MINFTFKLKAIKLEKVLMQRFRFHTTDHSEYSLSQTKRREHHDNPIWLVMVLMVIDDR